MGGARRGGDGRAHARGGGRHDRLGRAHHGDGPARGRPGRRPRPRGKDRRRAAARDRGRPAGDRGLPGREGRPDMSLLQLESITAGYGAFTALWDVSLRVEQGEAVAVVGPNGAGTTTLMRVVSGLIASRPRQLIFEGADLTGKKAYDIVAHGIAHVPE